MNLRVVADVDGKVPFKQKSADCCCMRMLKRKLSEGIGQRLTAGGGAKMNAGFWLDHDRGDLLPPLPEADQRTAGDLWMGAEDLFARLSEHRSFHGLHPFSHAPAEPKVTVAGKITRVSHPVPNRGRARWR